MFISMHLYSFLCEIFVGLRASFLKNCYNFSLGSNTVSTCAINAFNLYIPGAYFTARSHDLSVRFAFMRALTQSYLKSKQLLPSSVLLQPPSDGTKPLKHWHQNLGVFFGLFCSFVTAFKDGKPKANMLTLYVDIPGLQLAKTCFKTKITNGAVEMDNFTDRWDLTSKSHLRLKPTACVECVAAVAHWVPVYVLYTISPEMFPALNFPSSGLTKF